LTLVGAARNGKALGFVNPTFYSIGTNDQSEYFNVITSGSNGLFTAAAGWNAVTGWGSMKLPELFQYMTTL
jgi:kumamolisin